MGADDKSRFLRSPTLGSRFEFLCECEAIVGVAVVHVIADSETGEVASLEVLARHGEFPEEFEEQIRAARHCFSTEPIRTIGTKRPERSSGA